MAVAVGLPDPVWWTHVMLGLRLWLRWSVWVFEPVKRINGDLVVAKQDMSVQSRFTILIIGTCWKINVPQRALEKKCAWRKTHHSKWKLRKKTKAPWIALSILQGMCYKKDILCWQLLLGQFLVTLSTKQSVKTVFNDRFWIGSPSIKKSFSRKKTVVHQNKSTLDN